MWSCSSPVLRRPALVAVCLAVSVLLSPSLAQSPVDEPYSYNDALAKRVPSASGFHGMRGKKDLDFEDKRAPASGFVGMRGKKFGEQDIDLDMYEKRAPSAMGFQGMRGKKDDGDMFSGDKRVGFVGMRGKKDPSVSAEEAGDEILELQNILLGSDGYKRAPSSGFLGLRGKKAPSQGFLGLRGKKAPSDSSFFGMRGKKSPGAELDGEPSLPELLGYRVSDTKDLDDLLYYLSTGLGEGSLRQKRYPNNIKKKPSGFLGMRGKKYWVDSKDVAFLDNSESEGKLAQ
uniref:Tachykinin-related peptide n=1 Tax=Carausius morosus TaxID=7022 RepID=A0A6G4ZU51_CARMO|nr:tachykinin-related peptide [Carausius morosus]